MKVLCDTHALAWWLLDDRRLSAAARAILIEPDNQISVSAVSAFEIAIKHRIGKWPDAGNLIKDFHGIVERQGFRLLHIDAFHALRGGLLPGNHRDPFDRLLAGQSLVEVLPLVTNDAAFAAFGVEMVW